MVGYLSLLESPTFDPAFYAIWKTLVDYRMMTARDLVTPVLDKLATQTSMAPQVGPRGVFLNRANQLGRHWDSHQQQLVDQWGDVLDVWDAPIQDVKSRAQQAWQTTVAGKTATRKTFGGMEHTCAIISTQNMPSELSILRTAMNGTFYTADHKQHFEHQHTVECLFC